MADTTVPEALWARLLEALGLAADTDPETVIVAVEELTLAPGSENAVAAAAVLASAGRDALDQLRADAEQGRAIAAAAKKREVTDKVHASIHRGAIPPARKQHWIDLIEADPTMADTLASIPDDTIPLREIGHGVDPDAGGDDLIEAATWFR
ncbi:hypothetical protein ACGFIU_24920 [Rhodococcus oryzae]|uniref:hypothetical protein n=1 Tax=Rhodococcus oryzae TaxID=2571143 RepID=UPI00370FA68B